MLMFYDTPAKIKKIPNKNNFIRNFLKIKNKPYLIFNVISAIAANSIVTIQKRMVIFTSCCSMPLPLNATLALPHLVLKNL